MSNRHYESVVIINASLEDDQIESTISRVEETLKANGGEIVEMDKWGRKRLAYPINKSKSGYYVVIRFEAPSDLIAKLERTYRLDENVIRYLTITLDKKALKFYEDQKLKAEKEQEIIEEEKKEAAKAEEAAAEESGDKNESDENEKNTES